LVANCDIKVGSIISREIIGVKRPGTGIPPKEMDKVVGLKVIKKIFQDQQLAWENFKNSDE
jgi:sialic acid synthase SpsE